MTQKLFGAWSSLIASLRIRDAKKIGDKIIAFVGVAKAVQAGQGMTYFAGAWVECLSYDLLWHASYDFSIISASIPMARCTCKEQAISSVPWSYLGLSHYTSQHFSNYIGFSRHCREQNQQAYNATPAQFQ
jgi:hypothetical protein